VASIVHPGWSYRQGRDDISLCLLGSPSNKGPVAVASGQEALGPNTGLMVAGFGSEAEGQPNALQLEASEGAGGVRLRVRFAQPAMCLASFPPRTPQEVEVYPQDMAQCNATYGGLLRGKQLCAGAAAALRSSPVGMRGPAHGRPTPCCGAPAFS
jgi:hypothetical protein